MITFHDNGEATYHGRIVGDIRITKDLVDDCMLPPGMLYGMETKEAEQRKKAQTEGREAICGDVQQHTLERSKQSV